MSNYYNDNNKKGGYKNSTPDKKSTFLTLTYGNKKKAFVSLIAISLVLLLVVGALGFLSGGFLNWDLLRWIEKPAAAAEITNTLPLSVTYVDLTKAEFSAPESEDVYYIYYLEFDGEFDYEDVALVEICISSASERYSNIFYRPISLQSNDYYPDEDETEIVNHVITRDSPLVDLGILLINGYSFNSDLDSDLESVFNFITPEDDNSVLIVCFEPEEGNEEMAIPSDLIITITAAELIALDTPVVEDNSALGVIQWSEIDNAASYKVYVDDEDPVTVTDESYNYTALISTPGQHTISVQAVPGTSTASLIYDVSEISEAVTVTTGDLVITSETLTLSKDDVDVVLTFNAEMLESPDFASYDGKILTYLDNVYYSFIIIFLEDLTDDAMFGTVEAGTIVIPFFDPTDTEELGFDITPETFLDAPHVTIDLASEPESVDIDITEFETETTNNGTWTLSGLTYDYE